MESVAENLTEIDGKLRARGRRALPKHVNQAAESFLEELRSQSAEEVERLERERCERQGRFIEREIFGGGAYGTAPDDSLGVVRDEVLFSGLALGRRRSEILTDTQWIDLLDAHGYQCLYCGAFSDLLTLDHIVAVKSGGVDHVSNCAPSCKRCNSSKGHRPLRPWLVGKGYDPEDVRRRWDKARPGVELPL